MTNPFLFEVGVEEMPAGYLAPYAEQLAALFADEMKKANIAVKGITTLSTPRRLVLHCARVAEQQPVIEEEVKGPPCDVAFANGQPTRAATAFAEKAGVTLDVLERRAVGGKEYLFANVTRGGARTIELLPGIMAGLVRRLKAPKTMRWADAPTVFARPIRWLVAVLGTELVPVELDGLRAGLQTRGHRFLATRPVRVTSASLASLTKKLHKAYVVLDVREREQQILQQLAAHGAQDEKIDRGLVRVCANLVEWPSVVRGAFDPALLELPEPVLITALKKHQKSFCVYDEQGALAAGFLSVANNDLADEPRIRAGYERVITARLADAKFFWDEDRQTTLTARVERLRAVVFQEKLGTYFDKTQRVAALARALAALCGRDTLAAAAARAAWLSRADLTTAMVYEFPELQGVMGRIYARVVDGEPAEVAGAIEEMYQPRGADDALPASGAGALVSVADKLDTIVGCCAVGLGPTGSADPYAVRRQALGVVRILVAHDLRLSLGAAVGAALAQYPAADAAGVHAHVLQVLRGRFETVLKDAGVRYDISAAVLASPAWEAVTQTYHKAQALMTLLPAEEFRQACTVLERCENITRAAAFTPGAVDPAAFVDARETQVWQAWTRTRELLPAALQRDDVRGVVGLLAAEVAAPLHAYFEGVRVNVEDAVTRTNRLRMLRAIRDAIVAQFADLGAVVFDHTSGATARATKK
jgi:glycyl-tRNA synthetase beta chain